MQETKKVTLIILDYKRSSNIKNHILPYLCNEPKIHLVVILHGFQSDEFGFHLGANERKWNGNILHIENSRENKKYVCWRRWRAIRKLYNEGIIKTEYILSIDDDILFCNTINGIVNDLIDTLHQTNSLGVSHHVGGRIIDRQDVTYNWMNNGNTVNGKSLIIGQTMFLKTSAISRAVDLAESITGEKYIEYLHEDDIAICMCILRVQFNGDWLEEFWNGKFSVCNRLKYKILDGFHNGISSRSTHVHNRTNAVRFWINRFTNVH